MNTKWSGSNLHQHDGHWLGRHLLSRWATACLALGLLAFPSFGAEKGNSPKGGTRMDPVKRAESIRRVCERLGIGAGKVIADVGCGKGTDTMTFAEVVGPGGKVYAEEIEQKLLDEMLQKTRERKLEQVVAVLGATEDPHLPDGSLDMIFMHQVFHHFAKPLNMLNRLWVNLKPGGCLVIVDRQRGPQREWVDMAGREKKHSWTGETTVVRLARESGFRFEAAPEELWADKQPFVFVFRKPKGIKKPAGDPDLPAPIKGKTAVSELPVMPMSQPQILFVGIDHGRSLLPELQKLKSQPHIYDAMIEEWTTWKDELPADAKSGTAEIVRTANDDLPGLANRILNAAVVADAYSRLWDPAPLLKRVHQSLSAGGYVAILDRKGPDNEPRRLAGHNRRIATGLVKSDMEQAGFEMVKELKTPAKDRFFLLFRPRGSEREATIRKTR